MEISYYFSTTDYQFLNFCCYLDNNSILDQFLFKHYARINDAFCSFVEKHSDLLQQENEVANEFFCAVCKAYKIIFMKNLSSFIRKGNDATLAQFAAMNMLDKIAENPDNPEFIEQLDSIISIVLDSILKQLTR